MDQLMTENNRLSTDLEKCQKLNELLLKYRLYFKEYLKVCKCKQTMDQSLIRLKTVDLEEEFRRLNGDDDNHELKTELEESNDSLFSKNEDIDNRSDTDEEQNCFGGQTSEDVFPINKDVYVCQRTGCNQRFDSNDSLEYHSMSCQKNVRQYKCFKCSSSFDDMKKLNGHQSMHKRTAKQLNGSHKFVCQEIGCNRVFDKKISLSVHISRIHKTVEQILSCKKSFVCNWVGCGHKTANSQDLSLHIRRRHTLEKPFKCDECDKSYELEKLLRCHQKIHSNFRHKCDFEDCLYKTPHIWELKTHIKNKHLNEERFICDYPECQRNYKYESDLKMHVKQTHLNERTFPCEWPGCHKLFTRSETLKNHMLRHKNERQFKCDADGCGKAFNTKKELSTHLTIHQGTMYKFACEWPGCTRMLASRCHIKEHINSAHLKIKAFACDLCDKTFTMRDTLRTHKIKAHSGDGHKKVKMEYKCEDCMRVFRSSKNMENHKKSAHNPEELFPCDWPECEQRFKTSYALTTHKSVHMIGQYKCCAVNCGKSFTTRETLLSHELIHNKKFVCNWPGCGKRFAKNFHLTNHIKRHQNIREFKCEVGDCGQSFVTKTQLNYHLDKHSNPLPFKCVEEGCDRAFSRKSSLHNHLEKVHHVNI